MAPRESDEVAIEAAGTKLSAKGRDISLVMLFSALVFAVGYTSWSDSKDIRESLQKHEAQSKARNDSLDKRMQEAVFVLTLTEKQRQELHLEIPDSLRDRVHYGR